MDAFTFLERNKLTKVQPVYVLSGSERLLKNECLAKIRTAVVGDPPDELALSTYDGESVDFATVHDDLATRSFFSARRLVVVRRADRFVSNYRLSLEKYCQKPIRAAVLVLEVDSWRSNTRLGGLIASSATISCALPQRGSASAVAAWVRQRAQTVHDKKIEPAAVTLLVDLIGSNLEQLDSELAKLTAYVGDAAVIRQSDVDRLVAHSRQETVWQMLDAAAAGDSRTAIRRLEHLFEQGDDPLAILGPLSWQVRKLAQASRLCRQGMSVSRAVRQVGLPPFKLASVEAHLKRLGPRAERLYDWLLEADLALKSSGQLPPRLVLERLLVRIATPAPSPAGTASGKSGIRS